MSIYKKIATLFALTLLTHIAQANPPFPRGCEVSGFGFQGPYLTFNDTGNQAFFLVRNQSNLNIELERVPVRDAFMTPKLQTKLNANQWAALASDVSNTHFKCFVRSEDDTFNVVTCANVLQVCQYPRVRFALSNKGTYWVSTNKPQQQVIQEATQKGIYLKW